MYKVIVIGCGWSGCAAALTAGIAGAEVTLLEKTGMSLGFSEYNPSLHVIIIVL